MKRFYAFMLLVIITLVCAAGIAWSGPIVIRDSRINDPAITPALGRGYTLVTNTYQSMCLDNLVTTEPSYDFQYTFESVESENSSSKALSSKAGTSVKAGYASYEINSMVEANSAISTDANEVSHHVKVELNMDTYYASVDEAKTNLSTASRNLLNNKDLPGFFSACGSNYIRSLGRNAKLVSIFTYTSKSTQRDAKFEASLKLELSGMVKGITIGAGVESSTSASFRNMASERKLIINTRAWGLGKNEGATLISYDIDTFKAAIKDAFISMQNPMTGKITSMEVVPWVEYTGFQDAVILDETEGSGDAFVKEKVPNYKKKDVLNQNAEFLGEIQKSDRNRINNYYTAKICKETINADYKSDGKFIEGFESAKIVNHRTGKAEGVTIGELDKILSEEFIDGLLTERDTFMYGGKGAQKCMDKMFGEDMFRKRWSDYPECTGVRSGFVTIMNSKVYDYCMPAIAPDSSKQGN